MVVSFTSHGLVVVRFAEMLSRSQSQVYEVSCYQVLRDTTFLLNFVVSQFHIGILVPELHCA